MSILLKILSALGVITVVVFSRGIGKFVESSFNEGFAEVKNKSELNSALMTAASQINKNLPEMIDSETRLDSTIGINKQFRYNYTMVNYLAEKIDVKAFTKAMQPSLINSVCTTNEMKVFMKNGVPVTYAYYGKNGKQFAAITVRPSQCSS